MAISNVQLVKWTFPFALIIGLFWYKRRRVDRVDPGGEAKLDKEEMLEKRNNLQLPSMCDSGINIESLPSTPDQKIATDPIAIGSIGTSPRRVSESLDIPRRSVSQPMSMKSGKSGSSPWYTEVEDIPEVKGVELGSNPKPSKVIARSKTQVEVPAESVKITPETTKVSIDDSKTPGQAISDRDSANHSPVSGVLDGSVNDEVRSEGSTDSGKGR